MGMYNSKTRVLNWIAKRIETLDIFTIINNHIMGKCLITKLAGVVSNTNLIKVNESRFILLIMNLQNRVLVLTLLKML